MNHDIPKAIKRALRDLTADAHEEELRRALVPLHAAFERWSRHELSSGELERLIHDFHQGPARKLFQRYNTSGILAMNAAHAIVAGLVDKAKVAPQVLDYLSTAIQFYEEQERSSQSPGGSESRPGEQMLIGFLEKALAMGGNGIEIKHDDGKYWVSALGPDVSVGIEALDGEQVKPLFEELDRVKRRKQMVIGGTTYRLIYRTHESFGEGSIRFLCEEWIKRPSDPIARGNMEFAGLTMKTINVPQRSKVINALLTQARGENVIIRSASGEEFILAEIDDFDREVELTRQNRQLMKLLDARARQKKTVSLAEAKRQLGIEKRAG